VPFGLLASRDAAATSGTVVFIVLSRRTIASGARARPRRVRRDASLQVVQETA